MERREFTDSAKRNERIRANGRCRICGSTENLQLAHIYSSSLSQAWERKGSRPEVWRNDKFVCSSENALLLCKFHHDRIDSQEGMRLCTVEYLNSLKEDLGTCTALVTGPRRCKLANRRGRSPTSDDEYHCTKHRGGGIEKNLPVRTWVSSPRPMEVVPTETWSSYIVNSLSYFSKLFYK